jgi:hypothetical protein
MIMAMIVLEANFDLRSLPLLGRGGRKAGGGGKPDKKSRTILTSIVLEAN